MVKKVGLVTYHHSHLKTEQVIQRLLKQGFSLTIYALHYKEEQTFKSIFNSAPDQSRAVEPQAIALKHNIPYVMCMSDKDINNYCDIYILLNETILSPECTEGKTIINCHSGILPAVRGFDTFKWSIHDMKPLGVTLHYVNLNTEDDQIISIIPTDVYPDDTLESLARRHYENELDCLANFQYFIDNPVNPHYELKESEPKLFMNEEQETETVERFNNYLAEFS